MVILTQPGSRECLASLDPMAGSLIHISSTIVDVGDLPQVLLSLGNDLFEGDGSLRHSHPGLGISAHLLLGE